MSRAASQRGSRSGAESPTHVLPPLPYGYGDLEPCIDSHTMKLHHDKHHAAYVEQLNAALEPHADLRDRSLIWLLTHLDEIPVSIRSAVRNNGGGHLNHSIFWATMSPGGGEAPNGALAAALHDTFGGLAQFKAAFVEAGTKLFGSGWVWLVRAASQGTAGPALEIVTTSGHDNPIRQGKHPVLVNDVWEHAYYLKYENRRPEYLDQWWSIVDWKEAERRFAHPGAGLDLEPTDATHASNS
jgi:Fe-Mn family superoxide dismutase